MTIRLGIKRPLWADITAFTGTVDSVSYRLVGGDGDDVIRIRNSEDPETYVYTAREALALIKAFEGAGNDASLQAWGLIGINTFLDTYTFAPGVKFPDGGIEYLFIRTSVGEGTIHYVVACRVEYCW